VLQKILPAKSPRRFLEKEGRVEKKKCGRVERKLGTESRWGVLREEHHKGGSSKTKGGGVYGETPMYGKIRGSKLGREENRLGGCVARKRGKNKEKGVGRQGLIQGTFACRSVLCRSAR